MRVFWILVFSAALTSGCNGPCGEYDGEVNFQEMFGTDTKNCYTGVEGDLTVNITDGFKRVSMPHLTWLGGDLRILCNYDLVHVDFGSLEYVEGRVEIQGNRLLPDLNGLKSLKYIGGSLTIGGQGCRYLNAELADISGLDRLESVGGDIRIEANPNLPTCAADALVQRLEYFPGIATIDGNDSGATCE